ncbi:MAG: hypothetical protein WD425_17570 [Nitrospirales bacterium]
MLESIYHTMPGKNFSSDLLPQITDHIGVVELRDVMWSDWGQPERIVETLRSLGKVPAFSLHDLRCSVTMSDIVDPTRYGHEKTWKNDMGASVFV